MTGSRPQIEYIDALKTRMLQDEDAMLAVMDKLPTVHRHLQERFGGDIVQLTPEAHRLIGSTQNPEITMRVRSRIQAEQGIVDAEIDRRVREAGAACQLAARDLLADIAM